MSKKYKNNVIIEDKFVIKKNNKINELYEYFDSVGFNYYPKIIDYDEDNIRYEYIESKKYHEESKGVEFIKIVALLHYKTLFFKDVSINKYKLIYNKLLNNISYLEKYYDNLIEQIEKEIFMSPSHYLIARNYSIIVSSLKYSNDTLKKWYKLVLNKTTQRVCVIHNNLSLEHYIKGEKDYLISFDNHMVDTPILDIYKFYKKEGHSLDFNYLLKVYNDNLSLLEEEKLLLNILISIPPKIESINDEYLNTINIKNLFNYIYSSMKTVYENK